MWDLELGEPFDAHVSYATAVRSHRDDAVLKIPMPGDFPFVTGNRREHEHLALDEWRGDGAVRLLRFDASSGAMLLERCRPAAHLVDAATLDEADEIVASLLIRLWRPVPDPTRFQSTAQFARELRVRAEANDDRTAELLERSLLDDALSLLTELEAAAVPNVLLHGDLHHKNVVTAEREPWLAIDPLPRVGDTCYDAVQFLMFRKGSTPDPARTWAGDIGRFCALTGLDAERVARWIFVRLVTDGLAELALGTELRALEAPQEDLWSARLARRLL